LGIDAGTSVVRTLRAIRGSGFGRRNGRMGMRRPDRRSGTAALRSRNGPAGSAGLPAPTIRLALIICAAARFRPTVPELR